MKITERLKEDIEKLRDSSDPDERNQYLQALYLLNDILDYKERFKESEDE